MFEMMESQKNIPPNKSLIWLSIGAPLIIASFFAVFLSGKEYDLNIIYKFLKVTERFMLTTFFLGTGAATVHYFFPHRLSEWLLRQDKYWGIAFAVFSFIYYIGLFLKFIHDTPYFIKDTTILDWLFVISACVFSVATVKTLIVKRISRKWEIIHANSGNCLWIIFWFVHFNHNLSQSPVFLFITFMIVLRVIQIYKSKGLPKWMLAVILLSIFFGTCFLSGVLSVKKTTADFTGIEFKAKDYFPLYEGNSWTYRMDDSNQDSFVQKYEIRGTEHVGGRETFKLYFSENGYKNYAYDETGIRKYKELDEGRTEIYDPPSNILPDLSFNIKRKFQSNYTEPFDPYKKNIKISGEILFNVSGVEDIVVKAGKFKGCIRVEYIDKWIESDGSYDIITATGWYAKNVGVVKEKVQSIKYDPQNDKFSRYQENVELINAVIKQW